MTGQIADAGKRGRARKAIDGRSSAARRHRALAESFAADLGGMTALTNAERGLIDQAATLMLRAERMKAKVVNDDPDINDDAIVRLSNAATRILSALRSKSTGKPRQPQSIDDYLKAPAQ